MKKQISLSLFILFSVIRIFAAEININSKADFSKVIPRKTYVLLVGNDEYPEESNWRNLKYCRNDILLMKKIFINCCKVNPEYIFAYGNLKKPELLEKTEQFLTNISRDSLVILFFSGHGDVNGSFICSDGGQLSSGEIRRFVNSFSNDTVLMIDACYSGENEGFGSPSGFPEFKENSIRIYSSLGYRKSIQGEYRDNAFFQYTRRFYAEVLGLPDLEGNSYFTASVGSFFAHYQFGSENIDYHAMITYMNGLGKRYLEYLFKSEGYADLEYEDQLPKIEPISRQDQFKDKDHTFLIFQKQTTGFRPKGNFISLAYNPALSIPQNLDKQTSGLMSMGILLYNINIDRSSILGIGIQGGYESVRAIRDTEDPIQADLYFIPLALHLRYLTNFLSPFFFLADINLGGAWKDSELIGEPDFYGEPIDHVVFFGSAGIGVGVNPVQQLGISINLDINWFGSTMVFSPGITVDYIISINDKDLEII